MPKRKCTFTEEIVKKYPSFRKAKLPTEAHCTVCQKTISIANKGKGDIEEHVSTMKHQRALKSVSSSTRIDTYTQKLSDPLLRAGEATLAFHTVIHHQSFRSLDCTVQVNKLIYSDSELSKKLTCGRTKATALIKNVLSPFSLELTIRELADIPYIGVATDSSNHLAVKQFPIVIQYFANTGIEHKLLDICTGKNEVADTISSLICEVLEKNNLKKKCIAFCADNTNTNFGGRQRQGKQNVFTRLRDNLKESLIGVGCPNHILNNAVHKGCDTLPVDMEMLILKVYNYFSVFTVRTEELKDFCYFIDEDFEYKPLLYHSKTRWLSLFPAIKRFSTMFQPLKSYFQSIDNPPVIIKKYFENEFAEAYLELVISFMSVFHSSIKEMEKSNNSLLEVLQILRKITQCLEERIENNFIPLQVSGIFYASLCFQNNITVIHYFMLFEFKHNYF